MSYTAIAVLVVPLVLALINWQISASVQRGRFQASSDETVFPVSPLVFLCCAGTAGMFAVLGLSTLDDARPQSAIAMIVSVSALAVLGSFAAAWWYAKSAVRLTDDELIIEAPFSRKAVRFDQIKDVRVTGGMIVVDEGKIPRLVVPIIYRKTGLLLANIESRRFNRPQRPQA
jgi:hypothetical protein